MGPPAAFPGVGDAAGGPVGGVVCWCPRKVKKVVRGRNAGRRFALGREIDSEIVARMGTFKKWSVSKRVFCPNKAARRARFRAFRCLRVTGNVIFAFPYGIETCLVLVCVAVAPFCRIKIWRDSATPQKRCGSSLQPSVSRALQFAQQRLELRGAGRLLCGYVSHGQHLGASVKGRGCGGGRVDGGPADRHRGEHRRGQKKPARG